QLVDEEGRGVAEVEDQRVAQGDRLDEIGFVAGQALEQGLVAVERVQEIAPHGGAQAVRVRLCKVGRAREQGAGRGTGFGRGRLWRGGRVHHRIPGGLDTVVAWRRACGETI